MLPASTGRYTPGCGWENRVKESTLLLALVALAQRRTALTMRSVDVLTHLMFQDGRAREAAEWYVSLVPGSSIERVTDNGAGSATVYFTLADRGFIALDSPTRHEFDFTPSMSIFVRCDEEEQVRLLFDQIASDGDVKMPVDEYPFSSCFGWATDRYGVSWQIGKADRDLQAPRHRNPLARPGAVGKSETPTKTRRGSNATGPISGGHVLPSDAREASEHTPAAPHIPTQRGCQPADTVCAWAP